MKPKPAHRATPPRRPVAVAVATEEPGPRPRRGWGIWYALGILAAAFLLYARSLNGAFLFDDADILEANSSVRLKDWWIILTGPRPLLILTYALNHWLTGANTFYFHLVNVLLHGLNALILWRVVGGICRGPALARRLAPAARGLIEWAAPLLFLATPLQTESVSYISSRSELMAAFFYLLALWVFVSGWREKRPWLAAVLAAAFYGCSVTSKQHGLTLPFAILLIDWFFLAGQDWRRVAGNWRVYALLGAEMAAGGFVVVRAVINVPSAGFFLREVSWQDYLLTQFRMYFLYLRLLIVPFGLNADYDIQPSRSLFEHGSWLALAGILALAGAAWNFRRRAPLASFGVLFFFLALAPTSSFFPLLDYAAERRLYLPSAGFFLALLGLAAARWGGSRLLTAAVGATLAVYAVGTHARNRVWQDPLALWQDASVKSPGKWRAHNNLGYEYSQRKKFVEAIGAFERAAELAPPGTKNQAEILSSLGSAYANQGRYEEAVGVYKKALAMAPDISTLWTNLGVAEVRLNRAEGWERFQKAIELNGLAWEPHFARGNLYYEQRRFEEAVRDYERVLYLRPDHGDARHNLQAARAMRALSK